MATFVVHRLVQTAGALGAVLLLGSTAVLCYQVVARNFASATTDWVYQLAGYMDAWAALLGFSYALHRQSHISSGGILGRIKRGGRGQETVVLLLRCLVFAVVAVTLLVTSINVVLQRYRLHLMPPSGLAIPLWVVDVGLVIGAALIALEAVAQVMDLALSQERTTR